MCMAENRLADGDNYMMNISVHIQHDIWLVSSVTALVVTAQVSVRL